MAWLFTTPETISTYTSRPSCRGLPFNDFWRRIWGIRINCPWRSGRLKISWSTVAKSLKNIRLNRKRTAKRLICDCRRWYEVVYVRGSWYKSKSLFLLLGRFASSFSPLYLFIRFLILQLICQPLRVFSQFDVLQSVQLRKVSIDIIDIPASHLFDHLLEGDLFPDLIISVIDNCLLFFLVALIALLDVFDTLNQSDSLELVFSESKVLPTDVLQWSYFVHVGFLELGGSGNEVSLAYDIEGDLVDGVAEVAKFKICHGCSYTLSEVELCKFLKFFHLSECFDSKHWIFLSQYTVIVFCIS